MIEETVNKNLLFESHLHVFFLFNIGQNDELGSVFVNCSIISLVICILIIRVIKIPF